MLLAVIGLLALLFPVCLDQYDVYGIEVTCGNGFSSNLSQAVQTVAIGWLLVTGFLAIWYRRINQRTKPHPPESIYSVQTGQF